MLFQKGLKLKSFSFLKAVIKRDTAKKSTRLKKNPAENSIPQWENIKVDFTYKSFPPLQVCFPISSTITYLIHSAVIKFT